MASTAFFFTDVNLSSGEREDRSNRWIFIPLLVIGLMIAYLPAYTERTGHGFLMAMSFAGLACFFMWSEARCGIRPIFVLGRRFSGLVAIQPGHELVTDDVYRIIRHPSYLGNVYPDVRMGPCFSFGSRGNSGSADHSAGSGAHSVRRGPSARTIRRAIRRLLPAHCAARSGYSP